MEEKNLVVKPQINPSTFEQRYEVATKLAKSGLTGALNTPEKVFLALQTGVELGISPMSAIRGIHVINNRPTLSADLMMGLIMARTDFAGISQVYSEDGNSHTTIIKRKFSFGIQEFKGEFSIADAANAGLIKAGGNWEKYKPAMLQHRSDSIAAKKAYPDLFQGVYTPEEIDPEFNERAVTAEVLNEKNPPKKVNPAEKPKETKKTEPPKSDKQPVELSAEDMAISLDKLEKVCKIIKLNEKAYRAFEEKAKFMPLEDYEASLTKSIIGWIDHMINTNIYNDPGAVAEILKIEDYKTMLFNAALAALEALENTFNPKEQGAANE